MGKLVVMQSTGERLKELYARRDALNAAIEKLEEVQRQRREIAAKVRRINGASSLRPAA